MTLGLWLVDENGTGLTYNISSLADVRDLAEQVESTGYASTMVIPVKSWWAGTALPVPPRTGVLLVLADDAGFPGNPDPYDYLFVGKVLTAPYTDKPYGLLYTCNCTDFTHELHTPTVELIRNSTDHPNDQSFLVQAVGGLVDLPRTWAVDLIGGPFVTYPAGEIQPYRGKFIDILAQVAADPGPDLADPVAPRRTSVTGRWANPANLNAGVTRYLSYYASTSLPLDPVPLTDDASGRANWLYDSFTRTELGAADTSQTMFALRGTWDVDGDEAQCVTNDASNRNFAGYQLGLTDCVVEAYLSANPVPTTAGIAGRVATDPTNGWTGWIFFNAGAGIWRLAKYNAGVVTNMAAISGGTTPGPARLEFSGNLITFSFGGVTGTFTDAFNNDKTIHGLYVGSTGYVAARWDWFRVEAAGATVYDTGWTHTPDAGEFANVLAVFGPGLDPEPVRYQGLVNTTEKNGMLVKTGGGNAWDAGARSVGALGPEGGEVVTMVSETPVGLDHFARDDNPLELGKLETGQSWGGFGASHSMGIRSGRAYVSRINAAGEFGRVADFGVSTCIIESPFAVVDTDGQRLVARQTDASNYLYVQAEAGLWRLGKRVAGVNTSLGTWAAAPANGDVVKLVLSEDTLQVYINNVLRIGPVTDAHNVGATKHGLGGQAGVLSAEWESFRVWQTYARKSFGLDSVDSGQSYTDAEFAWVLDELRNAKIYEGGALVGPTVVYSANWHFMVRAKLRTLTEYDVTYWYRAPGSAIWTLAYTSLVHPTLATTAYHVDLALYHTGSSWDEVLMRRYAGKVYRDDESIDVYGEWPADSVVEDDSLDTVAKRDAHAAAFFGARAGLRNTYQVVSTRRYRGGTMVVYHNGRAGIQNTTRVVARVQTVRNGRTPQYLVSLDNPKRVFGERNPLGYLVGGPDNPVAPVAPQAFQAAACSYYRGMTTQMFTFDIPSTAVRSVEIRMQLVNAANPDDLVREFPAAQGRVYWDQLPVSTSYVARARFFPYVGPPSAYTDPVELRTCDPVRAPAPDQPTLVSNIWNPERGLAVITVEWTPVPTFNEYAVLRIAAGRVEVVRVRDAFQYLFTLAAGLAFSVAVAAVDPYTGQAGFWSPALTGTAAGPVSSNQVQNPSFEILEPESTYDVLSPAAGAGCVAPWAWETMVTGGTACVDSTHAAHGVRSVKLAVSPGSTQDAAVRSRRFLLNPDRYYRFRARFDASLNDADVLAHAYIRYYDNSGGFLQQTTLSALGHEVAAGTWLTMNQEFGPVTHPDTAYEADLTLENAWAQASAADVWFDDVLVEVMVAAEDIPAGTITPSNLADVVTGGTVVNPTSITYNSKGQVTAAVGGGGAGGDWFTYLAWGND